MATNITEQEIDAMDLLEAAEYLENEGKEYEHLQTLEEMKKLIKTIALERDKSKGYITSCTTNNESQEWMAEILLKNNEKKQVLLKIYGEMEEFVGDKIGDELREVLGKTYPSFDDKLQQNRVELGNEECPIVVAGETSAGKSSLLNLLLGAEVLPYSLLCATSTICRLHHSDQKKFVVVYNDNQLETHTLSSGRNEEELRQNEEELLKKLNDAVSNEASRKKRTCKHVDIYWPIPMLENRVTIVDTPGVGENTDMTNRLLEYLPNAIAFMYVINSANAGGIQDDKILHILSRQRQSEEKGGLSSFDPNCTMFVCNKWDIVEKRGEEALTWKDTIDKLKHDLPTLPESQIFKMSTTEASRYVKSGLGPTEKYQALLKGIKTLVRESMSGKINRHYRWMSKFLGELQSVTSGRINHAKDTEEEKKRLHDNVLIRLNKLSMDATKVKGKLIEEAENECMQIADGLLKHLEQPEVKARLNEWRVDDAPDIRADDFEVTRFKGVKVILDRIKAEIWKWESQNGLVKAASARLTKKFTQECHLIGQETRKVNLLIEGDPLNDMQLRKFGGGDYSDSERDHTALSRNEKIVLAVSAPLWFPIVTAVSLLFVPVVIGILIKENISAKEQRKCYMENKVKFMREWTTKIMETSFTKENITKFIGDAYLNLFKKKIEELCNVYIPNQIAADRLQANNIANDRRTSQEILRVFQPIQSGLKVILAKLRLFDLKYMANDVIEVNCLKRKLEIGEGSFSNVYRAIWTKEGGTEEVAIKVLKPFPHPEQMYSQLCEVSFLRTLKHPNIVRFFGVCYSELMPASISGGDPEKMATHKLIQVFEVCDEGSLEDIVFRDDRKKCSTYETVKKRQATFDFYVRMAKGVCAGLHFMHSQEYLHSDLKLSNVLVKGGEAKLCDFGFTKTVAALNGSFVGTMTHMSPDMLEGKRYSFSHDIYSLGILLWELWYGRHVYSEPEYCNLTVILLMDAVRTGQRPRCHFKYPILDGLKMLLEACWNKEADDRPSAEDVKMKLEAIHRDTLDK